MSAHSFHTRVTLPDAMATGKLTLRTNAVVRHVLVDNEGRPKAWGILTASLRRYEEAFAKVVVLAASTLESTRIHAELHSRWHPNGLANSSGVLGHYLSDHFIAGSVSGILPELVGGRSARRRYFRMLIHPTIPQRRKPPSGLSTGYAIMFAAAARMFPRTRI